MSRLLRYGREPYKGDPWPLDRMRDWKGRFVSLRREMTGDGWSNVPAGTVMIVCTVHQGKLQLVAPLRCSCCGHRRSIDRVETHEVDLVNPVSHDWNGDVVMEEVAS